MYATSKGPLVGQDASDPPQQHKIRQSRPSFKTLAAALTGQDPPAAPLTAAEFPCAATASAGLNPDAIEASSAAGVKLPDSNIIIPTLEFDQGVEASRVGISPEICAALDAEVLFPMPFPIWICKQFLTVVLHHFKACSKAN